MNLLEKILHNYDKEEEKEEINIIGGISYCEAPSIFRVKTKTKTVRIVFKDEKGKGDRNGKQ